MGYIYLITNTKNNKKYIGQTLQDDIESRWKRHKAMCKNSIGRILLNAYKKYDIDKFKFQIVCICFDEDCNIYEEQYIKKFNTLHPNGYNLKEGGLNSKHHPSTIEKMREAMKGRECSNKHYWTDERKKQWSEMRKGEKNSNYGKFMSDEQKKKISNTMKISYANNTKEKRNPTQKQLEALKNCRVKKSIGQYNLEGKLIKIYDSVVKASIETNICRSTISCVCRGVSSYQTAGGFVWKFLPKDYLIH